MGKMKDFLTGALEHICAETGCEWEHLEGIQEETGYDEGEVLALYDAYRNRCKDEGEEPDYVEFYDYAVNSQFDWSPEAAPIEAKTHKVQMSKKRPRLTTEAMLRVMAW